MDIFSVQENISRGRMLFSSLSLRHVSKVQMETLTVLIFYKLIYHVIDFSGYGRSSNERNLYYLDSCIMKQVVVTQMDLLTPFF